MSRGRRSQPSPERTEEERERDRAERERRRAERAAQRGEAHVVEAPTPGPPLDVYPPADPVAEEPPSEEHPDTLAPPAPDAPPAVDDGAHAWTAPAEPTVSEHAQAAAGEEIPPAPVADPAAQLEPQEPAAAEAAPPEPAVPGPAPADAAAEQPEPHRELAEETPPVQPPPPGPPPGTPAQAAVGPDEIAAAAGPRLPPAARASAARLARPAPRVAPVLRRRGNSRSPVTRGLALVALAVVLAAVVLLFKSLFGGGQEKKAAVVPVVKVVIPEGTTRLQAAQITRADGLKGSYRGASQRSSLLSTASYGAPAGTRTLEGFLFPATYDMDPGAPVSRLVRAQLVAFKENFGSSETGRARSLHVTPYQLLTVASMVEREAKIPGDRGKIAAVIYNRLKRGMPLGIDATIYYAIEVAKGIPTYTNELTEAQLHLNSPYNTRTRPGLPPTPISNPGLASIAAAAKPAHVPYLYYVLAPDGCGEHAFSTTLAKFEADAAAYKAAVAKNGGAPPSCKKK